MKTNHSGFSLFEILIALFLGAMILGLAAGLKYDLTTHDKLETTMENFEKAIRFAVDEAALRNKVARLRLIMDTNPQEFVLELGKSSDFVLPKAIKTVSTDVNIEQLERQENMLGKINSQFSTIKDFQDDKEEIPQDIYILGVGSGLYNNFIDEAEASIFIYPSGEKDSAIIFLGTKDEIATLEIEEFTLRFKRSFFPNQQDDIQDILEYQSKRAEEIFKKWQQE